MSGKQKMLFGEVAVQKGYAQQEKVMEALKMQLKENMNKDGKQRPIGMIMVQMGIITKAQIEEILKFQI